MARRVLGAVPAGARPAVRARRGRVDAIGGIGQTVRSMRHLLSVLVLAPFLGAQSPAAAAESLFDGRTLAGWRGDPAVWSVRDGCITGSTVGHPVAANTFLVWQGGELADFELRAAVRLEGDNNSGIQYRSWLVDGQEFGVAGYQCDVHPAPAYQGMLYEEKGAGILCQHGQFVARDADGGVRVVGRVADPAPRDLSQWHQLRIVAKGNLVWHELDGAVVAVVHDDSRKAPRQGVLALQVHSGPAMTVQWKDLQLVRLAKEETALQPPPLVTALLRKVKAPAAGKVPQFKLGAAPDEARLVFTCDNHARIYVNGERVASSDAWEVPQSIDVQKHLRAGDNVLAVHGSNDGGPAGLALRLTWVTGKGAGELVSDGSWRCSDDDPDGWDGVGFADDGWRPATVVAALGAPGAPWSGTLGEDAFGSAEPPDAPQVALPAEGLSGPLARDALQLLAVPRAYGSWVSLCADDRGRLYASDQARGLYRVVPAKGLGGESSIEKVDVDLDGAQGLCWHRGALYAVVSVRRPGLYRLTDCDGDDRLDKVELLRALDGDGEHGPHGIVVAPDGQNLLVMCGNHTKVPKLAGSRVPLNWAEDRLIDKIEDPNGHAVGIKAPGGWVCLVDPDGQRWEMYCCGFRNAYDLAVLENGDMVTYDSDMEWDMGLPWYRPTKVYQVLSGVDYGWRSGTSTWPGDYPEAPPAIVDIGPGSPTGLCAVGNLVLALDWTFGTIYGITVAAGPDGLHGTPAPLLTGVPLALADIVAADEHCYVLTGGRGIPSRLLRIANPGRFTRLSSHAAAAADRARSESRHGQIDDGSIRDAYSQVGTRSAGSIAARLTLEAQRTVLWRDRALTVAATESGTALMGLLALVRSGEPADLGPVLEALGGLPFAGLSPEHRIWWLRVHALALLRLGPITAEHRALVAQRLLPLFPTGDERVDGDLAELLAFVDAPGFLDKAVPMLSPVRPAVPPPWAETVTRNASYGGVIQQMLADMPPTGQIAIANALRAVRHGWTLDQRRAYLTFLGEARRAKGGASYDGYLKAFVDAAWRQCSPAEQQALAELVGKAKADLPKFQSTRPKGPGRDWQMADAVAAVRDLGGADLASGRNLFHAASCASCHYFAGEGGNHGPDLTSAGNKFGAQDVLEAVLEPNKAISDQYSGVVVTMRDGKAVFGRATKVQHDGGDGWEVMPAVANAVAVRIPAADVQKVEPSKLSPMPAGLVNGLNPAELRDLVAFVLSRGQGLPAPK
jgi:putative heme-binding domain-containing protein